MHYINLPTRPQRVLSLLNNTNTLHTIPHQPQKYHNPRMNPFFRTHLRLPLKTGHFPAIHSNYPKNYTKIPLAILTSGYYNVKTSHILRLSEQKVKMYPINRTKRSITQ